jgi:hypothetical protein
LKGMQSKWECNNIFFFFQTKQIPFTGVFCPFNLESSDLWNVTFIRSYLCLF